MLVAEVWRGSLANVVRVEPLVLNYGDGTIAFGELITAVDGEEVVCIKDTLLAIEAKAEGEVEVCRKCNERKKEMLRVNLTCSSKLWSIPTDGSGSSMDAGPFE